MKAVSDINCLNRPLEAETLKSVTSTYGALPQLILPPVIKYTQSLRSNKASTKST